MSPLPPRPSGVHSSNAQPPPQSRPALPKPQPPNLPPLPSAPPPPLPFSEPIRFDLSTPSASPLPGNATINAHIPRLSELVCSHASMLPPGGPAGPSRTFCKPCNQSFRDPIYLIAHERNEHVQCAKVAEGECSFHGLPAVVELHEQDRHLIFRPGAKKEVTKPDGPLK